MQKNLQCKLKTFFSTHFKIKFKFFKKKLQLKTLFLNQERFQSNINFKACELMKIKKRNIGTNIQPPSRIVKKLITILDTKKVPVSLKNEYTSDYVLF